MDEQAQLYRYSRALVQVHRNSGMLSRLSKRLPNSRVRRFHLAMGRRDARKPFPHPIAPAVRCNGFI